jgi:K(+)-stimulated pyrophosphate-energized sodium pump
MGALYKGLIVTGVLSSASFAIAPALVGMGTDGRRRSFTGMAPVLVRRGRPRGHRLIIWITEYYTGTNYPSGEARSHRPR